MATAAQMDKAVDLAEGENGYGETACSASVGNNTKFGIWYGMNCAAWCAMFVSWAYFNAGAPQPASSSKGFAYTPSGAAWYQSKGAWAGPSANPQRGWVVFFYSASAGRIAHVGLVRGPKNASGWVPTVEGNTNGAGSAEGGGVLLKIRDPSQAISFRIAGYGIPGEATAEEWWDMPIPETELAKIASTVVDAMQSVRGKSALVDAVRYANNEQYKLGWRGETASGEVSQPHYLISNAGVRAAVANNLVLGLAAIEAGGQVDLSSLRDGIELVVKEAATEALAGIEVGPGGASAEEIADAVARLAGERLSQPPAG